MQGLYKQIVLADNPTLYWPLNETSGSTAEDASPNNLDGTYAGTYTQNVTIGVPVGLERAVTTTSADITIAGYDPYVNATIRSFEIWAMQTVSTANAVLLSGSAGTTSMYFPGGGTSIQWYPNNSAVADWTTSAAADNVWAHYVLVFNESTNAVSLYKDGTLVSALTNADAYGASSTGFRVGKYTNGNDPWIGQVAHAAVYEYALTVAQIHQHYLFGQKGIPGLAYPTPGMGWR